MKAIEMTKLLELVTTEVTKDFTDRNGELKDVEILALRKVAEHFEILAEIADSVKDLNKLKKIINE